MKKTTALLAISLASLGIQSASAALSFTQLDLNGNYNMSSSGNIAGFPLGNQTYLGGVPFTQNNLQGQVWNAAYLPDGTTSAPGGSNTKTINTNVADARGFYSVINTWWGDKGPNSFASLTFNFSDSSSFSKNLVGNVDIRDFNYQTPNFSNQINNTTTRNVYLNTADSYAQDRQWFDFGVHSGKTLTQVTFNDWAGWGHQRLIVSGATVQSGFSGQIVAPALLPGQIGSLGGADSAAVPEPGQIAASLLLLTGIGGYVFLKRRKAAKPALATVAA
jgi:hypothetical protein